MTWIGPSPQRIFEVRIENEPRTRASHLAAATSWLASLLFLWPSVAGLIGSGDLVPNFLELGTPTSVFFKWLSIASIAVWVMLRAQRPELFLAIALLIHSVGDVVIAVGPLIGAIAAFLLGHLCYTALFWQLRERGPLATWRKVLIAGLVLYALGFGSYLIPKVEGVLQPAVAIYCGCIMVMAIFAARVTKGGVVPVVGALLYVFSDSLIGQSEFVERLPGSGYLIWPTYFLGQWAIVWGLVSRSERRAPAKSKHQP